MSRLALAATVAMISVSGFANAGELLMDGPGPVQYAQTKPPMSAESGWYLGVFAGGVWPGFAEFNYDGDDEIFEIGTLTGWTGGVAAGTRLMDMGRVEIELSHVSQGYDVIYEENGDVNDYGGAIDATFVLGNLWLDFDTGSAFTPYVGVGLGAAHVYLDDSDGWFDSVSVWDGFGVAYQLGAGVMFEVDENLSFDLAYRFKGVAKAKVDNLDSGFNNTDNCCIADVSFGSHIVQVGANLGF